MNNVKKLLASIKPKADLERKKRANRAVKKKKNNLSRSKALPKVPLVQVESNYINPITLISIPRGVIIYEISNRITGRKNYYNSTTFWKLAGRSKNNYGLLMANPKKPFLRNPVTRGNVYPRNIQRVKAIMSKSAAARKIQSAVRKHQAKKRVIGRTRN